MKEKLFFKNSKGNKLCGILSNPTSHKENPIIILCHGFSTGKDGRTYLRLEEILNKNGVSTLRFDLFGHGESEGKFEEITTSEAVDDIENAIQFLKASGYKKIGLFGSSFGGMASIIAASKTNDLYVLALKSPVSDYLGNITSQEDKQEIKHGVTLTIDPCHSRQYVSRNRPKSGGNCYIVILQELAGFSMKIKRGESKLLFT